MNNNLKVALVHDYLNQYGGAERVLEALSEMFPKAPIYTLIYDAQKTHYKFAKNRVITSILNRIPMAKNRHRLFIPFMPFAINRMQVNDYDLIISSSAGYAKGINNKNAFHITYCHTPLRYAWEKKEYLKTHPYFQSRLAYAMGNKIADYLRSWDKGVSARPNIYIANSNFIKEKIKNYYGRDSVVVYPCVDTKVFYREKGAKKKYFLAAGRMLHYKRFDLVIEAFNDLDYPLKIVGSGPELASLKKLAKGENIEFVEYIEDENELRRQYNEAMALIFPQIEDFGLVAAEAISCGTPVIAYGKGGAREIVKEGVSGTLFEKQNIKHLKKAINKFTKMKFNSRSIAKEGRVFSKQRFKNELLEILNSQGYSL